jgi:serine/threonine protein kinase
MPRSPDTDAASDDPTTVASAIMAKEPSERVDPNLGLGAGPNGAFFTMKRVRGVTLTTIIAGLRNRDPQITQKYSRRKLLTAISSVGLTLDSAHGRGVLHRGLKPGNIMLGDFGEVYVLDWGLAKLVDASDARRSSDRRFWKRRACSHRPTSSSPE